MFGTKEQNGSGSSKSGMQMMAESLMRSIMGPEQVKDLLAFFTGMQEWAQRVEKQINLNTLQLENISDRIGRLEAARDRQSGPSLFEEGK